MESTEKIAFYSRHLGRLLRAGAVMLPFEERLSSIWPSLPSRLVLRLHEGWGGVVETRGTVESWEELLLQAVTWLGTMPVSLLVLDFQDLSSTSRILRFADRLGCPVELLLGVGPGRASSDSGFAHLNPESATSLLRDGLRAARLPIGGLDPALHRELTGSSLESLSETVRALLEARDATPAPFELRLELPCSPLSPGSPYPLGELKAVETWARQIDVDALEIVAPLLAPPSPVHLPEETSRFVESRSSDRDPFFATRPGTARYIEAIWSAGDSRPGSPRRSSTCPIWGVRLEIAADGALGACPFHPPASFWRPGDDLRLRWAESQTHRRAVKGCDRACAHPSLAPPWTGID